MFDTKEGGFADRLDNYEYLLLVKDKVNETNTDRLSTKIETQVDAYSQLGKGLCR